MSSFKRLKLMPEAMYERMKQNNTMPTIRLGDAASLHNPITFKLSEDRIKMLTDNSVPMDTRIKLFYQYLMRSLSRSRAGEDPPTESEQWMKQPEAVSEFVFSDPRTRPTAAKQANLSPLPPLPPPPAPYRLSSADYLDDNDDPNSPLNTSRQRISAILDDINQRINNIQTLHNNNDSRGNHSSSSLPPYDPSFPSGDDVTPPRELLFSQPMAEEEGTTSTTALSLRRNPETVSNDDGQGSSRHPDRAIGSSGRQTPITSKRRRPTTTGTTTPVRKYRPTGGILTPTPSRNVLQAPDPLSKTERIAMRGEIAEHIFKYLEVFEGANTGLKWLDDRKPLKGAFIEKIVNFLVPYRNTHPTTLPAHLQVVVDILRREGFDLSRIPNESFHLWYQPQRESDFKDNINTFKQHGRGRVRPRKQHRFPWRTFE
jgi:hypothetical protein